MRDTAQGSQYCCCEAAALALAAETLTGCPFRLHGRDPATGLDCLGVVLAALEAIGRRAAFVGDYALRMRSVAALTDNARALGFTAATGARQAGDVILFVPGCHQYHLGIATSGGALIHAHAGLRRVVCAPQPAEWDAIGHWRLTD